MKKISVFLLGLCSLVAVSVYAGNELPSSDNQIVTTEQTTDPVPCNPEPCDTTCTPAPCNPAPCNPAPCNPGC